MTIGKRQTLYSSEMSNLESHYYPKKTAHDDVMCIRKNRKRLYSTDNFKIGTKGCDRAN